jgi:hypothetical protein
MLKRAALLGLTLIAATPAVAHATDGVSLTGGVLTVTVDAGGVATVNQDAATNPTHILVDAGSAVPTPLPSGCAAYTADDGTSDDQFEVTCTKTLVTSVVIDGGPEDDTLSAGLVTHPVAPAGIGFASPPPAPAHFPLTLPLAISAGAGDDTIVGGNGPDDVHGGDGDDTVDYSRRATAVHVSLNDVADDGDPTANAGAGEGDNVHSDVENIIGGAGGDALVGTGGPNTISGGAGADTITGGGGADALYGGEGNDVINAVDGTIDRVDCGDGTQDIATTDSIDTVAGCESDTVTPAALAVATTIPSQPSGYSPDADGDGSPVPQDCDDTNAAIHPGAPEVYGNAIDEDCSGVADPLQVLPASVLGTFHFSARTKRTKVSSLTAYALPAGVTVSVVCARTKGCPITPLRRKITSATSSLNLARALKLTTVAAGPTLVVTIGRPDAISKIYRYAFGAHKAPTAAKSCARPTGAAIAC